MTKGDINGFLTKKYEEILSKEIYSIDIETHDPKLRSCGPSWIFGEGEILVASVEKDGEVSLLEGKDVRKLKKVITDKNATILGANIAYDICWICAEYNIAPQAIKCSFLDIQIIESMIDEYQEYSLDALSKKYLKESKGIAALKDAAEENNFRGDPRRYLKWFWDNGYEEDVREYVKSDANQPMRIWEKQRKIVEEEGYQRALAMNMEELKAAIIMRLGGVSVDIETWKQNVILCAKEYNRISKAFKKEYGDVNVNSSAQLSYLLEENGIEIPYKLTIKGFLRHDGEKFNTKEDSFAGSLLYQEAGKLKKHFPSVKVGKGKIILLLPKKYVDRAYRKISQMGYEVIKNPVVDKFVLADLQGEYEVVQRVLELKQLGSIQSKFLGEKFSRYFSVTDDGVRLHGEFSVVGARQTGRLSSSKPNLQNIPSKSKVFEGKKNEVNLAKLCREVFIPEEGELFIRFDFSGQENVLQAHFATGREGKKIRKMYQHNPFLDEHKYAVEVTGMDKEHDAKVARKLAKNFRFGKSYGMQTKAMVKNFGWSKEEAEDISRRMELAIPWVVNTIDAVQDTVLNRRPYIKTLIGRKIHLRKGYERDAYKFYNYLIQGSASDMIKIATARVLASSKGVEKMLLTVHDENCYSIPATKEGLKRIREIYEIMEDFSSILSVPIRVAPEVGLNWYDTEEFDAQGEESLEDFVIRVAKEKGVKIK